MFSADLPRWALVAMLVLLPGCADPRGAYEEFVVRAGERDGGSAGTGSGPCVPPAPGSISGRALLAAGTTINPGRPILFLGQVETPEVDGKTAVSFRYHALDASDRTTEVGDLLELGPFPIEGDGSFHAETGEDTLPGEANALLPGVPISSSLILDGHFCGVRDFYCGTLGGEVTYPVKGPVEGSFALELVPGELPERPRYGCNAEDVAVELDAGP